MKVLWSTVKQGSVSLMLHGRELIDFSNLRLTSALELASMQRQDRNVSLGS
jgi:hypothetical protein